MERSVCWGCGEREGEPHDEECIAKQHAAMLGGDLAKALHDPDGCEACLASYAVTCECRCGQCCSLLIEATEFDAEREPRIRELGSPFRDQLGYLLNGPTGACVFLSRDAEGRGICDIYATRPLVCRLFDCDGEDRERLVELGILPARDR